jgi:hypothetical protein
MQRSVPTACALAIVAVFQVTTALAQPRDAGWTRFTNPQGTSVQFPRGIFPVDAGQDVPPGPVFATRDGRARIHIFAVPNERGESPRQYLRRNFPRDRGALAYDRVTRTFFAVSQAREGMIFYRRCNFPTDRNIHCVDIRYPRSEKRAWDATVTRVSLSLRPR